MLDQINFHEYPALADLGARYLPQACLVPQRDGMKAQQFSGGVQVEGFHAASSAMIWGRKSAWFSSLRGTPSRISSLTTAKASPP